jgi:hypothetical protein
MAGDGRAQNTIEKSLWFLEQLKPLQPLPVGQIRPADVLAALGVSKLRQIRDREALSLLREQGLPLRGRDPARRERSRSRAPWRASQPQTKHHAAIQKPELVGDLLRAIEQYAGMP